jgi:3-hydroxymyristoyl/3-hydroxydecanoyl-(acyl carrier protein) dehydratase
MSLPDIEVLPHKIREAGIRAPVFPGHTLTFEARLLRRAGPAASFATRATVDGKTVGDAEIVLVTTNRTAFRGRSQDAEHDV